MSPKKTAEAMSLVMFTRIEKRWLDYAWRVISDDDHKDVCVQHGGGGIDDASLRWPGYLGEGYSQSGIVFIANIHRDFNSGEAAGTTLAEDLVACSKKWLSQGRNDVSDREYLDETRRCYVFGLERWTIGRFFRRYLDLVGLTWRDIVYTNAARCQSLDGTQIPLQRICQANIPFSELEDFLRPCQIITCSTVIRDELNINAPRYWFHTRYGTNQYQQRFDQWSKKAAEGYRYCQLIKQEGIQLREEAEQERNESSISREELARSLDETLHIQRLNQQDMEEARIFMDQLQEILDQQFELRRKANELQERIREIRERIRQRR
jgi:hypothetical protein